MWTFDILFCRLTVRAVHQSEANVAEGGSVAEIDVGDLLTLFFPSQASSTIGLK